MTILTHGLQPLIHVGYHKTATTWLQFVYFRHHPELQLCGEYAELYPHFIAPDEMDFNAPAVSAFFAPRLRDAAAAGKVAVLSSERLSGNPHSGGYDAGIIARRLQQCFPQGRILLMVREQRAALLSNYKQYVRMGGICRLEEYLQPPEDGRIPLFRMRNFEYDRLVACYAALFGRQNVLVLPYELFEHNAVDFIAQVARFAGICTAPAFPVETRVNASLSDLATVLKRLVNRWHGGDSLFPLKPPWPALTMGLFRAIEHLDHTGLRRYQNHRWREQIAALAAGRFCASNRRLQEYVINDLSRFGYEL